ncbi:hypothetical protein AXK11_03570 [Cephaloticoccus primus]|uniref:NfeD-like C-terminal domain-containing protein n=1 Tax=Cephaloticoccus primus TaxID=1548207 RepID=A0A139SQ94_9BACT|nr:NfeD family protein [Cephaloticoccus primus]KXU36631.1 hypothetical protein AXK11_03570 [Cephaloticoccus primus]
MTAILLCFIVGGLLISFEVFVPGGILGLLGGLALLVAVGLSFYDHGVSGGALAFFAALAFVGAVLFVEFKLLPKTALGRSLFLKGSVTGTATAAPQDTLVGASGAALTVLAPSGYVLIDGRQHEAFSRSGFIAAGASIKVVAAESLRLIVISEPNSSPS